MLFVVLPASDLCQYKMSQESPDDALCTLVVDTGYSFTHIIPYHKDDKVLEAVKRLDNRAIKVVHYVFLLKF